jgi:predicted DNA-binding transcriptional regulator YafY
MAKSKLSNLKEAIKDRKKVKMTYYDDPDDRDRLIYPHAVYKTEDKQVFLDAYQVDGYSKTGRKFPAWKSFVVKDIKQVQVLNEEFKIVKTFQPKSGRYEDVIVMVEYPGLNSSLKKLS